jgi:hypothetical protein
MQQVGHVTVGSSTTQLKTVSVSFSPALTDIPVVLANTVQDPTYPGPINDTFAVSITSVSTSGFSANVYRVDFGPGGWDQILSLGWVATTPS